MQIIGITGESEHGKDTATSMIYCRWDQFFGTPRHGIASTAFADLAKLEIANAFGVDPSLFYNREAKDVKSTSLTLGKLNPNNPDHVAFLQICLADKYPTLLTEPLTPRFLMQRWGTEFRRAQDIDYWVRPIRAQIHDYSARGYTMLIVTDVRFENEAQAVREFGGKIWKVVRPDKAPKRFVSAHSSETSLKDIAADVTLVNTTLEQLRAAVADALPFRHA